MTINGPICRMCNVTEKVFLGQINNVQIHFCPQCDRKPEQWRR